MMSSFLLLVDFGGRGTVANTPSMISLLVVFACSAIGFVLIEAFWAKQPMLSPTLLRKAGAVLEILLLCAQFSVSALNSRRLVTHALVDRLKHCNVFRANRERVELCSRTSYHADIIW